VNIRPYRAADDAALMAIEYRSPRGASDPFVHYRHRFADRAALFDNAMLWVLEIEGVIAGCIGVALKTTQVNLEPVTLAYLFDLRVDPDYRRQGLAQALTHHAEDYAYSQGALGAYGLIVSVNLPSLKLFEQIGYQRIRQVLYLIYPPAALDNPPLVPIDCENDPANDPLRYTPLADRDFCVADAADQVGRCDYGRWFHDSNFGYASLSAFDQSYVYQQVSVDDLNLPEEILQQRSRSMRLFHPIGLEHPDLLGVVFDMVRDQALANNYYNLNMIIDAEETLPGYFFSAAEHQKRYWMVYRSLHPDFSPEWGSPFYIDPRDI
jgi:ribosomal protein S18 acetylase RimI-like enzyme